MPGGTGQVQHQTGRLDRGGGTQGRGQGTAQGRGVGRVGVRRHGGTRGGDGPAGRVLRPQGERAAGPDRVRHQHGPPPSSVIASCGTQYVGRGRQRYAPARTVSAAGTARRGAPSDREPDGTEPGHRCTPPPIGRKRRFECSESCGRAGIPSPATWRCSGCPTCAGCAWRCVTGTGRRRGWPPTTTAWWSQPWWPPRPARAARVRPGRARYGACTAPRSPTARGRTWPRRYRCCWPPPRSPTTSPTATACTDTPRCAPWRGRSPHAGPGRPGRRDSSWDSTRAPCWPRPNGRPRSRRTWAPATTCWRPPHPPKRPPPRRSRTPRCWPADPATRRRCVRRDGCSAGWRTCWTRWRTRRPTAPRARGTRSPPPAPTPPGYGSCATTRCWACDWPWPRPSSSTAAWSTPCWCTNWTARCGGASPRPDTPPGRRTAPAPPGRTPTPASTATTRRERPCGPGGPASTRASGAAPCPRPSTRRGAGGSGRAARWRCS